ncbi:unnamed protein product [Caenorhabditis nigoni]
MYWIRVCEAELIFNPPHPVRSFNGAIKLVILAIFLDSLCSAILNQKQEVEAMTNFLSFIQKPPQTSSR